MNTALRENSVRKRQIEHLERVASRGCVNQLPCRHDECRQCHGTGVKLDGNVCVHMISCNCGKCRTLARH